MCYNVSTENERTKERKTMGINKCKVIKSLFVVAVIVALFFAAATHSAAIASASARDAMYAMTAKVVEVNEAADLVTVMDSTGNLWAFYGCEDWQVNDCVSLVMYDAGTQSIYDDEIINARYNAWTLMQ